MRCQSTWLGRPCPNAAQFRVSGREVGQQLVCCRCRWNWMRFTPAVSTARLGTQALAPLPGLPSEPAEPVSTTAIDFPTDH